VNLRFNKKLNRKKMFLNSFEAKSLLSQFNIIFWDFDGVIKDSVDIKAEAFEQLFRPYGEELSRRVKYHHNAHGGMSRFDKIPLYLSWASVPISEAIVEDFCNKFSDLVLNSVISSPWVPGIREFISDYHLKRYFVLVTATPQKEIEQILVALDIRQFFSEIYGAPISKENAIITVLKQQKIEPQHAILIGDSEADRKAAEHSGVTFLLRQTPHNLDLKLHSGSFIFKDLNIP
jgi:phosphoglycolate phosphatase-like HAD superfamily hydrolase